MKQTLRELSPQAAQLQELKHLWAEYPALRAAARLFGNFCAGFLLAGSRIAGSFTPFAIGLVAAQSFGISCIGTAVGGCVGYLSFWGIDVALEPISVILLIFSAVGIFHNTTALDHTWFMPSICAGMTALVGLVFFLDAPFSLLRLNLYIARIGLAFTAAAADRLALQRRQQAACLFFAGTLICGMCAVSIDVLNLGVAAATAAAFATAPLPDGVVLAAVCGAAVDLSGIRPLSALVILSSLLVRFFGRRTPFFRPVTMGLLCAAGLVFAAVLRQMLPTSVCIGAVVGLAVPPRLLPRKKAPVDGGTARLQHRLRRISGVLEQMLLAVKTTDASQSVIAPEMIFDRAADKVCRCCVLFRVCWGTEAQQTYHALSVAAAPILSRGKADPEDFPVSFSGRCRHFDGFTAAVNQELDSLLYRRQYRMRTGEQQLLLADQLGCLSRILQDTAAEADWRFPTEAVYRLEIGCAAAGKYGSTRSGDQWACFLTAPDQCYVLLSDGMGTGEDAERESKAALQLLSELLKAGCAAQDALKMLNDLYLLRGDGVFSAVDVLQIDLCSAEAVLYKWGGAATYLRKNGAVKKIGAAAPPPGIGVGSDHAPERITVSLKKGEQLVLTTDGAAGEDTAARIAGFTGTNLKDFASYLIAGAQLHSDDDMSAIVLCLYPRHTH